MMSFVGVVQQLLYAVRHTLDYQRAGLRLATNVPSG
jgi:hypothetical protein